MKKVKDKPGRPLLIIDWETVDNLLEAGCSGVEIAAYLGISKDTLYSRTISEKKDSFTNYSLEKHAKGDSLLRAKQFESAMSGDKTMQIWLGKQRLGQKEKSETKNELTITDLPNIIIKANE